MATDQYLRTVTIGERLPHDAPVHLTPYDSSWPALYESLERRIRAALGAGAFALEHVGSTSVPGLCAKPVIDIVLGVADSTDEQAYVPALEAHGFYLRIREPEWFQHRLLKAHDIECNVHVFSAGCDEISRMLRFRDRLRSSEEERRLYEAAKLQLAARTWKHVQDYADAKTTIVCEILARQEEAGRAG